MPVRAETFSYFEWNFDLDSNGIISNICYRKEPIIQRYSSCLETDSGNLEKGWKLNSYSFNNGVLELHLYKAPWQLTEYLEFNASNTPGLLKRSAEIMLDATEQKEQSFFCTRAFFDLPTELEYYLPATVLGDARSFHKIALDPQGNRFLKNTIRWKGNTNNLTIGEKLTPPYFSESQMLFRTNKGTAILALADSRKEHVANELQIGTKCNRLQSSILSAGWAFPGKNQTSISGTYLYVIPDCTIEKALDEKIQEWYCALEISAPKDRPEWVENGMAYEINPHYFRDSQNLKRIENELVPRIEAMNFTIAYVQPVNYGSHEYLPCYYKQISPWVRSEDQYRNFITTLHKNGLRVWQDIVPHGGTLESLQVRGDSALIATVEKNGDLKNVYTADFLNPNFQKHLTDSAKWFMNEFNVDGFRIDQCGGSGYNWRKKGFPAYDSNATNISKNSKWFQDSLDKVGGVMPDLPYQRASLPGRAGFVMNMKIRNAAKENKQDAATLAEVITPLWGCAADCVYDLAFDMLARQYSKCTPDEYAKGLARYYNERQKTAPPGTLYLRVFQSHDVLDILGFTGSALGRAMYATCVLSRGVPLIDQYMEIGNGDFISRIQGIRKKRIELNKGDADYLSVKSTIPGVWTVLRRHEGNYSIGVVNFNPATVKGKLFVPQDKLPLNMENVPVADLLTKKPTKTTLENKNRQFELKLPPFGTAVLASVNAGDIKYNDNTNFKITKKEINKNSIITQTPESYIISGEGYSAVINRKNGLIEKFTNSESVDLFEKMDVVFTNKPEDITVCCERKVNSIISNIKSAQGNIALCFIALPDKLYFEAKLDGFTQQESVGLILQQSNALEGSWQVNSHEGILKDRFWSLSAKSPLVAMTHNTSRYRDVSENVLWDSESRPVALDFPKASMFDKNGSGFSVTLPDPLKTAPADWMIVRRTGESALPGMALYLKTPSVLSADHPQQFQIELSTSKESDYIPEFPSPINALGVNITPQSTQTVFENEYYKLTLNRLGGAINQLVDKKSGKIVLQNQQLNATNILRNNKKFSTAYDTDTGMVIREINGALLIRTLSLFCGNRKTESTIWNRVWTVTDLLIDSRGTIRQAFHTYGETDGCYKLIYTFSPYKGIHLKKQSDNLKFLSNDKGLVCMSYPETLSTNINIKQIDLVTEVEHTHCRKWHSFPIVLSFDGTITNSEINILPVDYLEKYDYRKYSENFEKYGNVFSLLNDKYIWNNQPTRYPAYGYWSPAYLRQVFDTSVSNDGNVSLKLCGGGVPHGIHTYLPAGIKLNIQNLESGKYTLSYQAKTSGLSNDCRFLVSLYSRRKDQSNSSISLSPPRIPNDSDWKEYSRTFEINSVNTGYVLSFEQWDKGIGKVWIDNVKINKMK